MRTRARHTGHGDATHRARRRDTRAVGWGTVQLRADSDAPASDTGADVVAVCAQRAQCAAPGLATASDETINAALDAMAQRLTASATEILAANVADITAAKQSGMTQALIDRRGTGYWKIGQTGCGSSSAAARSEWWAPPSRRARTSPSMSPRSW